VHLYEMLDEWRIATIVLNHRPHQLGECQFLVCHNLMFLKILFFLFQLPIATIRYVSSRKVNPLIPI